MRTALIIIPAIAALAGLGLGALWWTHRDLPAAVLEKRHLTPADRFVELDGRRVRVREEGPKEASPLLLVHGFSLSLESWDGWAAELAKDYRVIRMDLPAHGLTGPDPKGRYANADTARFLGELMDALAIKRAVIAGNSLGGLAAWRFAAESPDRVAGLILVDAGGFPNLGVGDKPIPIPPPMKAYLEFAPRSGVAAATGVLYADPSKLPQARVDLYRDFLRREGNDKALLARLEVFALPDPQPDLARVSAPTLILWGEKDRVIPVSHAQLLADALPNATVIAYPDAGHVPQEEIPQRSAADAKAFLAELGSW